MLLQVEWPVSLVLNHKALAQYQMLFRHFFYCKHIERLLSGDKLCFRYLVLKDSDTHWLL